MAIEMQPFSLADLAAGATLIEINEEVERAVRACLDPKRDDKGAVTLTIAVQRTAERAAAVTVKIATKQPGRTSAAATLFMNQNGEVTTPKEVQEDLPFGASLIRMAKGERPGKEEYAPPVGDED